MPKMLTYWDLIQRRSVGDVYYENVGFDCVEIPEDCAHIIARAETLDMLFKERYAMRELGYETLPMWQLQLQRRMDEVAHRYERMYVMYETKADELASAIADKRRTETYAGRSDTNTDNTTRQADTPDASINLNTSYGDRVSRSEGTGNRTDDYTRAVDDEILGADAIDDVNRYMDSWRDLDISLISEFENLFLNIFRGGKWQEFRLMKPTTIVPSSVRSSGSKRRTPR